MTRQAKGEAVEEERTVRVGLSADAFLPDSYIMNEEQKLEVYKKISFLETDEEKAARSAAIQEATKFATELPFHTMQKSFEAFEVCRAMVEWGNPASVTDGGVGALAARSAVMGAHLNVKINASSLKDEAFKNDILAKAAELEARAINEEAEIIKIVNEKIGL